MVARVLSRGLGDAARLIPRCSPHAFAHPVDGPAESEPVRCLLDGGQALLEGEVARHCLTVAV